MGDEAEIRFEFSFAGNLLNSGSSSVPGGRQGGLTASQTVSDEAVCELLSASEYTVKKLTLSGSSPLYVLSVFFIPWKTGELDMAPFDLASVFKLSASPLFIDIPGVEIQSISEKRGEKNLRPVRGPLIMPGTTYVVVLFSALILLFGAALLVVLFRFKLIRDIAQSFFSRIFSSHNYLRACRELLFLEKNGIKSEASLFCRRLSSLIRSYLEKRFALPFTAKTSGELVAAFSAFFAETASETSCEYMHGLYEVCARCDYIRFCGIQNPDFPEEERLLWIQKTRSALVYFEQPEEPEARSEQL
ncbi:hypothetical protein V1L52_11250 [Treponema sp. HNW]|uniref:hypothetical protein n=1 Tax=Treponema sp. HNW TaxID=3116654 RepID=UPI003D0A2019